MKHFWSLKTSALLLAFGLIGCVSFTKPLTGDHKPNPGKGYLYGYFERSSIVKYGLVIESADGKNKYTIDFESDVQAIEVVPGSYKITTFIASNFVNENIGSVALKTWPYDTEFTVAPKSATYIGHYETDHSGGGVWTLEKPTDRYESTRERFYTMFPFFSDVPHSNLLRQRK